MAVRGSLFRWMFLVMCLCISFPERTSQALPLCSIAFNKTSMGNSTTADTTVSHAFTADTSTRSHNCSLVSAHHVHETMEKYLRTDAKLVDLDITLEDYPTDFLQQKLQGVFTPNHWIRSSGRGGKNLLLLEENYDVMSVFFLSLGVYDENVILTDSPRCCLMNLNKTEILAVLRNVILNNFQPNQETGADGDLSYKGYVCNRKIKEDDGYATFPYECCYKSFDGDVICEEFGRDDWVDVFNWILIAVQVLVFFYSPSFLPKSLYRDKFFTREYVFRFPNDTPAKRFTMVKTQDPAKYGNRDKVVKKSKVKDMKHFKTEIETMSNDTVSQVTFDEIRLLVKRRHLLDENQAPVGLFQMIYNNLLRCRIRHWERFKACCDAKICGKFNWWINVPWSKIMRFVGQSVVPMIVIGLWVIRMWFYFKYEEGMAKNKERAADAMGLEVYTYHGLHCFMCPCNVWSIVVYSVLFVGLIFFWASDKAKTVTLNCLMATNERSHSAFFAWCNWLLLKTFEDYGLIGLPLFGFVLFFELLAAFFYLVPLCNLFVRLFHWNGFPFKDHPSLIDILEKECFKINKDPTQELTNNPIWEMTAAGRAMSCKDCFLSFTFNTLFMSFLISFSLLLSEIVSFILQTATYTLIGIILHADSILKYITIVFLTLYYGRSYLNDVWKMYFSYYKKILSHLLKLKLTEMNEMTDRTAEDKKNTAMCVHGENVAKIRLVIEDGRPMWRTSSILLFLDRQDTVHTPVKFFYKATKSKYCDAPGPPYRQYILALWRFAHILLFLLIVFIVVMAFGDAYKVSTTNQLLITVTGSVTSLIFLNIFSKRTGTSTLHTDKMPFDVQISHAVSRFMQTWPASDIIIKNCCKIDLDQQDGFSEGSVDLVIDDSTPASRRRVCSEDRGQDTGSVPMSDAHNLNRSGGGKAPMDSPPSTSDTSERDNVV